MKSFINLIIAIPALLFSTGCDAQVKNAKQLTVHIDGNCDMCKKNIEKAANEKKVAQLDWNKDSKQASLSYDSSKTTPDAILKRVALAGYDNEKFLAPDDAYAALPECCKYERSGKHTALKSTVNPGSVSDTKTPATNQNAPAKQLSAVLNAYFELKDALVKTDTKTATLKVSELSKALSVVDMANLDHNQHSVWMKTEKDLIAKTTAIVNSKTIEEQRTQFMALSETMHELAKVAKAETPVYYQHCPMYNDGKGANWLSLENTVKNPYYGSQMLSCGKTVETIK